MYTKDLIKITNGRFTNLPKNNKKVNKFRLDSRKITYGDVFICINSGINYVDEAIKKGCICIISDQEIKIKTRIGIIKVDDIKVALLKLGSYIRNKYKNIPLIAITGSVGKTTTKELLYNILSTKYNVLKNDGNKNNYIGVADTLFNIDDNIDIVITELGMNHMGEINDLSKMVMPDISIITNIGTSHIGNLGSKKNILKAKLEIINGMKDGYLVVPPSDLYLTTLNIPNILKCYDFDIRKVSLNDKLNFNMLYDDNIYQIIFNVPNKSYINNIILAFKVSTLFNIDNDVIVNVINNYQPIDKRMNIIKKDNCMIIDDSYNSSYESLKGCLNYLKTIDKDKILILGSIKELGFFSAKIHKKVNKLVKKIKRKTVLLVGDETKYIKGIHFKNNEEIINYLKDIDLNEKVILVKGSRAMKLDQIKDYLISI